QIRCILLKGPAVSRWLYSDEPAARRYNDIDLLIQSTNFSAARDVLRALGFLERSVVLERERPQHAELWVRTDGAQVDLHRRIHGTEDVDEDRLWKAVTDGSEKLNVGDVQVEIPGETVRLLHVVLHLDVKDKPGSQAWIDLERAVQHVDDESWRRMAKLAYSLRIEPIVGERLRRVPLARPLAIKLELPASGSAYMTIRTAVERDGDSPQLYSIFRLSRLPTPKAKLEYVVQKLFPPRVFMRHTSALARRGAPGLALAYVTRLLWLLLKLPGAIFAWKRVKRRLS
ncbi:MAG TPA: nucleotidyltransferase family protein, partial [Acidimicrobiales bacterium]|nr:nucleotidyltransferase family protein [Acidimicrobiales bacterium]